MPIKRGENECLNAEQMLDLIKKQGWVYSNSGKNRTRLYDVLRKAGLQWTEEIVGYTAGNISLCRWGKHRSRDRLWKYIHTPRDYARWIKAGRLLKQDVEDLGRYRVEDIADAWNPTKSVDEVENILSQTWGTFWKYHEKWFPLNMKACLRKPIKKITLKCCTF
jgi:hypothetical protein